MRDVTKFSLVCREKKSTVEIKIPGTIPYLNGNVPIHCSPAFDFLSHSNRAKLLPKQREDFSECTEIVRSVPTNPLWGGQS